MKGKQIKILEMGDIHLGHPNTNTMHILDGLRTALPANSKMAEFDICFIAGDFFDRLLHMPDPNVYEIKLWVTGFLKMCKKYDIVLRVLEGTPSHDWAQSKLFIDQNELVSINADVKWVKALSIEHIERFGIDVLYVPDEWNPECDDTWKEVQGLLSDRDLTQVDFSVMHGAFDYQLPSHVPAPTHDPARYRSITRYLIFIGHIHKHTVDDRIVAAGSFDRLTHGEEETKGHIEVIARKNGNHDITFIPNPNAMLYKTLNVSSMDLPKALTALEKKISKLPERCYVRIQAAKTDPILQNLDTLRAKFPRVTFSSKVNKDPDLHLETIINIKCDYVPIHITNSNIQKLLMERLEAQEKLKLSKADKDTLEQVLEPHL